MCAVEFSHRELQECIENYRRTVQPLAQIIHRKFQLIDIIEFAVDGIVKTIALITANKYYCRFVGRCGFHTSASLGYLYVVVRFVHQECHVLCRLNNNSQIIRSAFYGLKNLIENQYARNTKLVSLRNK